MPESMRSALRGALEDLTEAMRAMLELEASPKPLATEILERRAAIGRRERGPARLVGRSGRRLVLVVSQHRAPRARAASARPARRRLPVPDRLEGRP